jgi:hypothetical protein
VSELERFEGEGASEINTIFCGLEVNWRVRAHWERILGRLVQM